MSNIREGAVAGQEVSLQIQFYDADGDKAEVCDTPFVRIRDINGTVIQDYTDDCVLHLGDGLFEYNFRVPDGAILGAWLDDWRVIVDEVEFNTTLLFNVVPVTEMSADEGPGKIKIGDDVIFDFTDADIYGINVLLKFLKARLKSNGVKPVRDSNGAFVTDGYGRTLTEECNVFDDDVLVAFLMQAMSEFNSTPFFTAYVFGDQVIWGLFPQVIVEGAYVYALATQSIVEKGRDFTITDGGVNYTPPQLGDFLQSHYGTWLSSWRERLKFIKNSIRPGPLGMGTITGIGTTSPAYRRLRHLRERRVI